MSINLQELTVKDAIKNLQEKVYSSKELLAETLAQIKRFDNDFNVFVNTTEDCAMKAAEDFDEGRAPKHNLAGIPVSVKDLFNMQGQKTTASSNVIKDFVSPYNSTVVERLMEAGSVIVGKTNLDAFAHGSSTETSDFFTTKNPWDKTRLPGGSSGGAAAAVPLGMGLYSIGSETAGSIRQPASWCGVTGFKPTYGRVSRYGMISMGASLDCPGPICKSIEDCAIVLETIAGLDPKDATTIQTKPESYFANLNSDIKGLKIGLPMADYFNDRVHPEVVAKVLEAVRELEKLGAEIVEISLMDPKYSIAVYTLVCRSEVSSNLGRFDGIRYGYRSAEEAESIVDQVMANRGEGFGAEAKQRMMTGAFALAADHSDAYYHKAQQVRTLITEDLARGFEQVDVIIGPSTPSTALKVGATKGNPLFGEIADALIEASTLAGCPGVSVPVGFDSEGLPVGMDIFAPQMSEQLVLNFGFAYQSCTDWHRKFPKLG